MNAVAVFFSNILQEHRIVNDVRALKSNRTRFLNEVSQLNWSTFLTKAEFEMM